MFYLILFVTVCSISVYYMVKSMKSFYDTWFDCFTYGFLGFLLGALFCTLLSFMTCVIVSVTANEEYIKVDEKSIVALNDNQSTQGHFYLGSGYIDGDMKYVYMTSDNYEMKMNTVDIDNVTLVYSNEPKIESYEPRFTNNIVEWLFVGDLFGNVKYKIYVPEGTVKQNFNIDLR